MLLKKLIKDLPSHKKNIKIIGLAIDSKHVKKGFIFFAIKGQKLNGENFIPNAVRNGASVIVCSKRCNFYHKKIIVIKTHNVRKKLCEISSKFYKDKPKNIIAVTGTNGKTSVAELFFQILKLNKIPVASIGTLGIKSKDKTIKSDLTSPDTISLHKNLKKIKENKIDNVIIEASSHGLYQRRIDCLNLKAGIFTNFSQDHLDYHKTKLSYLNAKMILFRRILTKKKVIISDKSIKEFSILKKISKKKGLRIIDIHPVLKRINNNLDLNNKFNKYQKKNLSMAIAAAKLCDLNENKIFISLNKIKDVEGRLELVKIFNNDVKVYVDFAHTPDALKKSLDALKQKHGSNISVVFGCGGNRDFKKRPLMGKIADINCNKIYITDDNPRNEKPEKIRKEIIRNIKNKNCFNISSRSKAIKTAIENAELNETILIAGKGHENVQIYKNKIIPFSDKLYVKKIKLKKKKLSTRDQNFQQNQKILKIILKKTKKINFLGISIDSRTLKKNNIFLTIKGKNKNGAEFVSKAMKKGAKSIVTSKKIKKFTNKIIKVKDEFKFLNNFASKKREKTKAKILAVTGSAGKTSLKNLIKNLLKNFGKTFCSPKSFNNQFGVPLSLSQLETQHEFAVFEIGMSESGEINKLSKLVKPHLGIITNIGEAHIENFKNLKGIADAKGEIINNIQKNGVIILNRDDKFFKYLEKKSKKKGLKIISFGKSKKSDVYPLKIIENKNNTSLIVKIFDKKLKLKFKSLNLYNILAALACLKALNLNFNNIIKHFKTYVPTEGRGKIHNVKRYNKSFKLIDESYNANPLSVKNAIKNFNSLKKTNFKKYLLLGDMLELGRKSEMLHKGLSKVINNSDIDKVFVKGDKSLVTYKNIHKNKRGNIFQHQEDVDFILNNIISNNDHLMIKGSNATGLNNLSKRIIKGF